MKSIRKHLSFANVLASLALFIALGGSAYAVTKNSVGTAELKNNAVTAKKIKKNAVTAAKVKKSAITTAKLRNNAVTSAKIANGAVTAAKIAAGAIDGSKIATQTLGTVPSAQNAQSAKKADTATVAESLAGQETFHLKLQAGDQKTIASHGAVSLYAKCYDDGGDRYISIYANTTVNGAVFTADDDLNGADPGDFLNTDTPEEDRNWEYEYTTATDTYVGSEIDSGFVLGPDGKGLVGNSEGIVMGINYAGADCITAGVINKIG